MRFLHFEKMQWVWRCLYYENLPRRRTSCTKISMQRLPLSNRFESQPIRKRFRQKRQSQFKVAKFCRPVKTKKKVSGSVQARLCYYTGNYYCPVCHWNDLRPIPGLVIQNWDFSEKRVCRS